ncbi:glycine cleavage system aminomethyltransferase GcvT [Dysgonomonas sp. BGC7]|uniref:glycine cleavage system aminomethyltransferase GcvT n=1 Tax=Dysgonomonas sp. BGC7 TaxID=1658008 RepID=UPI0006802549|nr:glycine cleavage system aminomethyltransferase GcvT [Dysgonomonas sp. BGC7]MBD8388621.1 glycine cleavage system aminomethyltransferase GcvT [Dysgonomonas sp. BGC7]
MKKTPFTDIHIALGAKMHEFAGYNMPIEYSGIIDEHMTVCTGVGVFDVSHMGEIWVKGPRAQAFIQRLMSNDISTLEIGKAQYSTIVNDQGGIVDDIIIYHYEPDKYMLVVNASNIEKDWKWLTEHNEESADLENSSENIAQLAIQGPKALETLQKLTKIDLTKVPYYSFVIGSLKGSALDNVIISNTGYTGAGGFEIYFYPQYGEDIWNAIFEAGEEFGIKPIGLGARDTLRLEMGFCLYGNDLDDTTTPIEAGLGWITKFVENKDFTARAILEKQKKEGVIRKLCGFHMLEKGIPRHGYDIVNENDEKIGIVTSGTMSPTAKIGVGLGYIKPEYTKLNTPIYIKIRNKNLKAEVVKPPFRKL